MSNDQQPDMTNRLAQVQAENVRALMKRDGLSFKELSDLVGVGYGALINSFRPDNPRNVPSKKTMKCIEEAYNLPHGALNKAKGYECEPVERTPEIEPEKVVAKIDTVSILMQVGGNEVALRVSKQMSQRILNMVLFDEES